MKEKPFRIWAYHGEWIIVGQNFSILPTYRTKAEMRKARRAEKKAARRKARKART